jgi:hypothetical protein
MRARPIYRDAEAAYCYLACKAEFEHRLLETSYTAYSRFVDEDFYIDRGPEDPHSPLDLEHGFLSFIMREVGRRPILRFDEEDFRKPLMHVWEGLAGAACGMMTNTFRRIVAVAGYESRQVLFRSYAGVSAGHAACEVLMQGRGTWCYFDPFYAFSARNMGAPCSLDDLKNCPDILRIWDFCLSQSGMHTSMLLESYMSGEYSVLCDPPWKSSGAALVRLASEYMPSDRRDVDHEVQPALQDVRVPEHGGEGSPP